jgi:hypothetical protein
MSGTVTNPGTDSATAFVDNGLTTQAYRLFDNIQAVLPSVQLPVMEMELWNTIQEFCQRSTYCRSSVQWQLAEGAREVDFNPYSATMTAFQIIAQMGLLHYTVMPPARMIDTGLASTVRNGWALLALKPVSYSYVPPILFDLWFEALRAGTMWRLYRQPAKPYSSPQLAEMEGRSFRDYVRQARDQAERFNSGQQPAWRFPYFAHGHRKN